MNRPPALSPKEAARILEHLGYTLVRQKGNHRVYINGTREIVVTMHSKTLKRPTQANIIKATGLTAEEFLKHR